MCGSCYIKCGTISSIASIAKYYKHCYALFTKMEETESTIKPYKYSINIKVSAKREVYGEFKVSADTTEELQEALKKVKELFYKELE